MSVLVPVEIIASKIFLIRGQKVMIDRDLAELYGVSTKALNQAVKRNVERFPEDFMVQLTNKEKKELVTNCDRLGLLKYSSINPYAFTQEGVAMLSSVLRSKRAVQVNIGIMRAFVRIREYLATHEGVLKKLEQHDRQIKTIFGVINKLLLPPKTKRTGKMGF
ncbi:MAG: ORF6N domain-containing protein [Elusimicrobiota bacterium]|nr:ORF6N domain-containing protein [Elusimicrobiota bacterium]